MLRFWLIILTLVIFLLLPSFQSTPPNAKEIIRRADEKRRGATSMAELSISIIRPSWSRDMSVKTWSKGTENALILIIAPVRDKGTVFLKRKKEIWNWIPSIDRNIKLPPSMMMQSWMGSDFTNDDLIKESSIVDDYNHRIVGDSVIQERACYKIELLPKPEAPVVWGKIYSWIDKNEYIELRSELYDEEGFLINEVVFSEIKDMDGRELPSVMEYIPVDKEGHKTVMRYHAIDYDIPLEESFFSLQNMKRVQ